jgi:hypothetical protein
MYSIMIRMLAMCREAGMNRVTVWIHMKLVWMNRNWLIIRISSSRMEEVQ